MQNPPIDAAMAIDRLALEIAEKTKSIIILQLTIEAQQKIIESLEEQLNIALQPTKPQTDAETAAMDGARKMLDSE